MGNLLQRHWWKINCIECNWKTTSRFKYISYTTDPYSDDIEQDIGVESSGIKEMKMQQKI